MDYDFQFMFNKIKLKQLRRKMGITQKQLANKTGLTKDTISNLERGITLDPYLSTACGLAKFFNIKIELFCENYSIGDIS